jgi:hypothetical protein
MSIQHITMGAQSNWNSPTTGPTFFLGLLLLLGTKNDKYTLVNTSTWPNGDSPSIGIESQALEPVRMPTLMPLRRAMLAV